MVIIDPEPRFIPRILPFAFCCILFPVLGWTYLSSEPCSILVMVFLAVGTRYFTIFFPILWLFILSIAGPNQVGKMESPHTTAFWKNPINTADRMWNREKDGEVAFYRICEHNVHCLSARLHKDRESQLNHYFTEKC